MAKNQAVLDYLKNKKGAAPTPARVSDKACPKCGSFEDWGEASWCPGCGYYPALHGPVEPKSQATAAASASSSEADSAGTSAAPAKREKPIQATDVGAMYKMLPGWAKLAAAGVVAVAIANLLAKFVLLKGSEQSLKSVAAAGEIVIAVIVLMVTHLASYLHAISKSDRVGPADIFLKPFETWKSTLNALPQTANRVCLLIWSVSAVLFAVFILGGITFEGLFDDWGVRRAAKGNLVQAIVKEAKEEREGEESLDGAMKAFTGEGENAAEEKREETDCVVIGYTERPDGSIGSLLLAAAPKGRLSYVGMLDTALFADDVKAEAYDRLAELKRRPTSLAKKVPVRGVWVEPKFLVRVSFTGWTVGYTLIKPKLVELLRASNKVQ